MSFVARSTLIGEVNEESVASAVFQLQEIDEDYPDAPVEFIINSEGGNFFDGVMLYGKLKELSTWGGGRHHLTTVIRGIAASTATLLVQAGDLRLQGPLDVQVWHEPQLESCGSEPISALQARIDGLRVHQDSWFHVLSKRTGLPEHLYWGLETPLDRLILADEALTLGLIDEIR